MDCEEIWSYGQEACLFDLRLSCCEFYFTNSRTSPNPCNLYPSLTLNSLSIKYIDTLCRELGIRTNRKSNPISEMFTPYRPSDYNGLIDEFLQAQQGKKEKGSGVSNGMMKTLAPGLKHRTVKRVSIES